ncbi:MAG TPA: ABC transporter permease [Gemmatimonadaceae bacterium]|nr:ABC transporter permease [Gemmatimonadaceae bacterium]
MIRTGIRRALSLALRRRDRWEHEVEEEIKLHLLLRAEQLTSQGASPSEAFDEAVRRFGALKESRARLVEAARQREARMQRTEYFSDLRQDLTFAIRTLRRDKGWTIVTILTLTLGIGAATAVFSAVSSVLLHPVAYPGADRVVLVYQQPSKGNNTGINVTISPSAPIIRAWKTDAHAFEAIEAFGQSDMQMRTTSDWVDVHATRIGPGFASFAGVRPLVGRVFTAAGIASDKREVLLGEGLWRTRLGANPDVIGRIITLDDSTYTIVGVLPSELRLPRVGASTTDVWLPLDLRNDHVGASVVARLRPGIDPAVATAELDSVYSRVSAALGEKTTLRAFVKPPGRQVSFRDSLMLLGYAVALVLLVACANVAHLMLARASTRRRELAIRMALGAGRSRVFRQLLTESVLLAFAGGALGVFAGWLGLRAILVARPTSLPALTLAHVDYTTLGAAIAITVLTSIVFGVLGAMQAGRESTNDALKTGTQRSATGRGRVRQLLVVTEMALSATLVVGASMLVRSVVNLQRANLGFEPSGLYTIRPSVPRGHFSNRAARGLFLRTLETRLASVPGVTSVTMASAPPGWWTFSIGRLEIEGRPAPPASVTEFIRVNNIQRGYFGVMRQGLVAGGEFTDTTTAGHQVIINAGFARKQWAGESPLGKHIRIAHEGTEPWLTVVGVAAEAATGGPVTGDATAPLLYTAAADSFAAALLVRTSGKGDLLQPVQALAHAIDADATVKLMSVESGVADAIAEPRFVMLLLTLFTALALSLAAIGLYGVLGYAVAQRTREIGIRVALGATRTRIARGVIAGGVALAISGAVVGLAIARWGTKVIETQLYGVARSDSASFYAAAIVLVVAALVACIVPTRRALAVDPMTAIRAD